MPRSPIDLPRMQNQPRLRVPGARVARLVTQDGETASQQPRKPQLMRQYELIDRVKQYNPATNEDLVRVGIELAKRQIFELLAHLACPPTCPRCSRPAAR